LTRKGLPLAEPPPNARPHPFGKSASRRCRPASGRPQAHRDGSRPS
jgi:hypothetical protein